MKKLHNVNFLVVFLLLIFSIQGLWAGQAFPNGFFERELSTPKRIMQDMDEPVAPACSMPPLSTHQKLENFNALPYELILFIFTFFNQKNIPQVARVCRLWNQLLDDDQLWRIFAIKAGLGIEGYSNKKKGYKSLINFHCCNVSFYYNIVDQDICKVRISPDGSLILISDDHNSKEQCFRWNLEGIQPLKLSVNELTALKSLHFNSEGQNRQTLDQIDLGPNTRILASSRYGSVMGGFTKEGEGMLDKYAIRVTAEGSIEKITSILERHGNRFEDFECYVGGVTTIRQYLSTVSSISASGTAFVGEGLRVDINPNYYNRITLRTFWYASIPRGNLF